MKMTKEEAKKLAKEGVEHSKKYSIPLKMRKRKNLNSVCSKKKTI